MMKTARKFSRLAPLAYRTVIPAEEFDLGALIDVPSGFLPANPSLTKLGDRFIANVRCVNYRLLSERTLKSVFLTGSDWASQNRAIGWSDDISRASEIASLSNRFAGIEDIRMLVIEDRLYASGTSHEDGSSGIILFEFDVNLSLQRTRSMPSPFAFGQEKNWAPFEKDGMLHYVYSVDPLVVLRVADDREGYEIVHGCEHEPSDISFTTGGSSQGIPYRDGWLFIFHRRRVQPVVSGTIYVHYCIWISRDFSMVRKGAPFVIGRPAVHFVGGLVEDKGDLLISYGRADSRAWLARVRWQDLPVPAP